MVRTLSPAAAASKNAYARTSRSEKIRGVLVPHDADKEVQVVDLPMGMESAREYVQKRPGASKATVSQWSSTYVDFSNYSCLCRLTVNGDEPTLNDRLCAIGWISPWVLGDGLIVKVDDVGVVISMTDSEVEFLKSLDYNKYRDDVTEKEDEEYWDWLEKQVREDEEEEEEEQESGAQEAALVSGVD